MLKWNDDMKASLPEKFSTFGLNADIYRISIRIQSKCKKYGIEKPPNPDIFAAVHCSFYVHITLSSFLNT